MADFDIEGLPELIKQLEPFPLSRSKLMITRALRKAATPIKDRARQLAPRGDTGTLRDSIMISVRDQTGHGAEARIGPSKAGWYGRFVEFGTSQYFDAAGARSMGLPGKHGRKRPNTGGVRARPYIRPAMASERNKSLAILAEEIGNQIEKEFRRKR